MMLTAISLNKYVLKKEGVLGKLFKTFINRFFGLALLVLIIPETCALAGQADNHNPPLPCNILSTSPFYPSVKTLSIKAFNTRIDDLLILDVRTRFEYDIIHIKGAFHLSRDNSDILISDSRIKTESLDKPVVFVGNDSSDTRPYKSALSERFQDIPTIFVLEEGVLTWAEAFPEKSVLMEVTPADPEHILTRASHAKNLLNLESFIEAASEPGTLVIDARHLYAGGNALIQLSVPAQRLSVEALLEAASCRIWSEKQLLIFDDNGSRLAWLHRFLHAGGYIDPKFLNGGASSLGWATRTQSIPPSEAKVAGSDYNGVVINQERFKALIMDEILTSTQKNLMLMIIAGLSFENCSVLSIAETVVTMDIDSIDLKAMADVLKTSGLILYSTSGDCFVFRLDPRLAWKGTVGSRPFNENLRIFMAESDPWRKP